jgi:hypothetical protein
MFRPVVKIFNSTNLESNLGLVQISALDVNTLIETIIRELWNWVRI